MNFLFYSGKQKEHAMPVCLVLRFNFHFNLLTVFTSSFGCRHSVTEKTKKKKNQKNSMCQQKKVYFGHYSFSSIYRCIMSLYFIVNLSLLDWKKLGPHFLNFNLVSFSSLRCLFPFLWECKSVKGFCELRSDYFFILKNHMNVKSTNLFFFFVLLIFFVLPDVLY